MSAGLQRALAGQLCDILHAVLPERLEGWAHALRGEVAGIASDGEALRFAFGGFCGLLPRALLARGRTLLLAITESDHSTGKGTAMASTRDILHRPRLVGLLCAAVSVLLGLGYMAAAGAPAAYLAVNLGAFALGLATLALSVRLAPLTQRLPGAGTAALALGLLATALFGNAVDGAARWVVVGPLFVQTSLLVLPLMIAGFARTRGLLATVGVAIAAAALALQPDRAMAGVLLAGLAALALDRFDRALGVALGAAALAFLATVARPDTLPAVPYVDRILYSAFEVHPLAGAAVVAGVAILLVPALVAWRGGAAGRGPALAFGAAWLAVVAFAAVGNYPTPVVGYGGSAIIGYLLSLAALPRRVAPRREAAASSAGGAEPAAPRGLLRGQALPA